MFKYWPPRCRPKKYFLRTIILHRRLPPNKGADNLNERHSGLPTSDVISSGKMLTAARHGNTRHRGLVCTCVSQGGGALHLFRPSAWKLTSEMGPFQTSSRVPAKSVD